MVGVGRVGSTTARAGRVTPGSSRSRICAVATIAPVEPADITAVACTQANELAGNRDAFPSLGRRQLDSAPSSMATQVLG